MTLENILLYPLIYNFNSFLNKECKDILINYNIYNVDQLEKLILSGNNDFKRGEFIYILKRANDTLDKIKAGILYNRTYNIDYDDSTFNKEKLLRIDQETSSQVLMVTSPIGISKLPLDLKKINIKLAKDLLQNYDLEGNNALVASIRGIGIKETLWNFIEALKFYNSYMLEISKNNPDYEGNLFFKDKEQKMELVQEKLNLILEIIGDYQYFIWGPASNLIKIIKSEARKKYPNWQYFNFINYISNYTSLEELQNDATLKLALNRFKKN